MSAVLLRKAHKKRILINPFYLSGILPDVVDNGYGEMIEAEGASPAEVIFDNPVRIGYTKKWIMKRNEGNTPIYVEKRVYHMISDHETEIDVGLEFEYRDGVNLKVKNRKVLRKFNNIIGYEYEIQDITRDMEYYG